MDIRFLKQLTPNVGYLFPKNHIYLSPTPAVNIGTIGIGQIIRNHPIYVPIHDLNSPYLIKKTCQYGGSETNIHFKGDQKSSLSNGIETQTSTESPKEPPAVTDNVKNPLKRKLNPSVKSSFDHPVIKTKVMSFKKPSNSKNQNFNFKIVD
jgi:hypothetical protein